MEKIKHIFKKGLLTFIILVLCGATLTVYPKQGKANDNNLSHTNGVEAAVLASIASASLSVLQGYLTRQWGAELPPVGPVWRPNDNRLDVREQLFRYDYRPPSEIFANGFVPRTEETDYTRLDWDLERYVRGDATRDMTPFVSTTRPKVDEEGNVLEEWTPTPHGMYSHIFRYEIFARGGIDVNASLGHHQSESQREIAFPGGIRSEFIRSVRILRINPNTLQTTLEAIVTNPNFFKDQGGSENEGLELPEITIPTSVEVKKWDPADPTGCDPKSKKQGKSEQKKSTKANMRPSDLPDPMRDPGTVKPDPFKNDPKNPRRIGDGEYQIRSKVDANKTVDLPQNNLETQVHLYQNYSQNNQRWQFRYSEEKKAYRIKSSKNDGLVLARNPRNNMVFVSSDKTVDDNGYWQLEENKDGTFTLRNCGDKKQVLDLNRSSTENGANISVYPSNGGGKNQKWYIDLPSTQPLADGEYKIQSSINKEALVDLSKNHQGAIVHIYQDYGRTNQRWKLKYNELKKAYHIISSQNPDLFLTMVREKPNQIVGWKDKPEEDNCYWQIGRNNDGSFTLKNYADGDLVLDLPYGKTENGTELQAYSNHEGKNQKWRFLKINNHVLSDGEYQISSMLIPNILAGTARDQYSVVASKNVSSDYQRWDIKYNTQYNGYLIRPLFNPFTNFKDVAMEAMDIAGAQVFVFPLTLNKDPLTPYWLIEETKDGSYIFRRLTNQDSVMEFDQKNMVFTAAPMWNLILQKYRLQRTDKPLVLEGDYSISTKLNYTKALDANRTYVTLFTYLGAKSQSWKFKYDKSKKAYKIYANAFSGKGLVYGNKDAKVNFDTVDGKGKGLKSYWTIEYDEVEGAYLIRSLYNPDQVLDLGTDLARNGTDPITSSPQFVKKQLWNLVPFQ